MLKKNKKTLILTSIIILLPVLVGIMLWDKLPDTMATHFGTDNEANGFSSKKFTVIGLPFILLGVQLLGAVVTDKDPRKQNISDKLYKLILWITPCVSIFVAAFMYPYNLGMKLDISLFAHLFTGLVFIIIGNYLPKARQNYTIGIKLPWTFANEENWNRTHRLAGVIWVISGIILILSTFIGNIGSIYLTIGIMLVAVIVPSIYSFFLHVGKGL